MRQEDAAKILNIAGSMTAEDVTKAYRKMCSKYHPDRNPTGLEMMKAINAAYEALKGFSGTLDTEGHEGWDEALNDAINAVINLDGVNLEICGLWIWLSGNTKEHKEVIKEAGYFWASKKKSWYFRPAEYKSGNRSNWSMDKIRDEHGTQKIKKKYKKALAA